MPALPDDLAAWISPVCALAQAAGTRIMAIYGTAFEVRQKTDHSPITAADRASHDILVAGLQRLTPDIPILSEESTDVPFATRRQWDRYWLLDPLDGTKEFVQRNGEFTVNIALIVDHVPVLGVVQAPVTGVCYCAAQGVGAFCAVPGEPVRPIAVQPLQSGAPIRVVGSRSHGGAALQDFVAGLGPHTSLVAVGSSLKGCLVAEGKADVYPRLGPTSEWDTAAMQAVLEVAGGQLIAIDTGQPLRYNTKEALRNPHFIAFGDARRNWLADIPSRCDHA